MPNPTIALDGATVFHGNNLDILPTLADNSIDSIVTDPPYELGFMGKTWDSSGIAYSVELWRECMRVLKPGGHLLAFGGSRTWHRLAVAIEDAGFEMRDSIAWLYGSGFPKSLDISKAIDKAAGAEREKVLATGSLHKNKNLNDDSWSKIGQENPLMDSATPVTPEAQKWAGWGTALKPAFEPVVVARKPLIGTVAENVLTYGTGGLNIDASRIGTETRFNSHAGNNNTGFTASDERTDAGKGMFAGKSDGGSEVQGRWPANIILDEYTAELLDEQAPQTGAFAKVKSGHSGESRGIYGDYAQRGDDGATFYGDGLGGASRFFYVAKASKRDRNEGLAKSNTHPTVKPTSLMTYLIKLVTPPNGTVLDPFTGSGSTGKAALLSGFNFVGIELTDDYLPIIEGRLRWAIEQATEETQAAEKEKKETLF